MANLLEYVQFRRDVAGFIWDMVCLPGRRERKVLIFVMLLVLSSAIKCDQVWSFSKAALAIVLMRTQNVCARVEVVSVLGFSMKHLADAL